MAIATARVHTTLNLSIPLMREAQRLLRGHTKTEVIHEALRRFIQSAKLARHVKRWAGKAKLRSYE